MSKKQTHIQKIIQPMKTSQKKSPWKIFQGDFKVCYPI